MSEQKINSLKALKQLQDQFYQAIFEPKAENVTQTTQRVLASQTLSGESRLAIYRGSILGGINTALTNIYPVCVKLVGEEYFTHMVAAYLKKSPSSSADLGLYGEHLPEYIAQFKPAKELSYLSDVARLELRWHKAFNAGEDSFSENGLRPLNTLETIAEQDHARIEFCLTKSVNLIASQYPIHHIWQVNQEDYQGEQGVDLAEGGVKLLVWRAADFSMRVDVLSADEYRFIHALMQGTKFDDISLMKFESAVSEILQRCIQTGVVVGFTLV